MFGKQGYFKTKDSRKKGSSYGQSSKNWGSRRKGSGLTLPIALQTVADYAFLVTFLSVLLIFAGRTPTGQLFLLIGTSITIFFWLASRMLGAGKPWKWTGLEPLFVLAIGMAAFQLVPLPETLFQSLSKQPGFFSGLTFPIPDMESPAKWNQLSYNPYDTRLTLSSVICVILMFLMLVQRFQDRDFGKKTLLKILFGSAIFALFAIVQYLTANGKFFWILTHPHGNTFTFAKGSFVNANHFAGYVCMASAPLLAWAISKQEKSNRGYHWQHKDKKAGTLRLIAGCIGVALLILGTVLSNSRGGLVLAGAAIAVPLLLVMGKRLTDQRLPLVIIVMMFCSLGGIAYFGEKLFQDNMMELSMGDVEALDTNNARRSIWETNLRLQEKFSLTGIGLGAHRDVAKSFLDRDIFPAVYTHAENSYLQIASELGRGVWLLLAIAVLLTVVKLIFIFFAQQERDAIEGELPLLLGIAGTFSVFLIHGTYDFGWYTPAYMLLLSVLMAYLFAWSPPQQSQYPPSNRFGWAGSLLILCLLSGTITLGPTVMQAAQAEALETRDLLFSKSRTSFESPEEELLSLRVRIQALKQAHKIAPENGRTLHRLASYYRRVYELKTIYDPVQSMPITQIRSAVYSGGFTDTEQLQTWLNNPAVMQKNYPMAKACLELAKRAVRLSPLETSSWLILADFSFLDSPDPELADYYMDVARSVEPAAAIISLTAGYHAWCRGDLANAYQHWKPIFKTSKDSQQRIIEIMTLSFGPDEFINHFEPDITVMLTLTRKYRDQKSEHYPRAALKLAELTLAQDRLPNDNSINSLRQRQRIYIQAFDLLSNSDQLDQTMNYIQQVSVREPENLELQKKFGHWLANKKQYQSAIPYLERYLQAVSHDPATNRLIKTCREELSFMEKKRLVTPASHQQSRIMLR